ncbi:ABC transporter ATP-binding protein [Alphaproteobacteria bacterium]|nr:ABC transporter ATP-binding protein [Alphaproteobacteria bacterium]MDC3063527.1 ABC transporter ATP-binding protein [Alphaproteobacteria bacterium]
MTTLLKIEKLSAWYGDSRVLKEVDIEINDGEIVALLGRNGMGKTTTLHSVCGIIEKISGNIFFNKNFISNLPSYEISKLGIGLVPEGRRIFSNLTVEENLIVASRKGYWDLNKIKQIFPRLSERLTQMSNSLSGGEQQMLAIARTLMTNPKLLILDEATEGLSPNIRNEIWTIISQIKKKDVSIILVDKYLNKIKKFADKLYILERGENAWNGKPSLLTDQIIKKYLSV